MSLLKYFKRKKEENDESNNEERLGSKEPNTSERSVMNSPTVDENPPNKKIKFEKYPVDKYNRTFQSNWLQKFEWLEYSKELDRVFCSVCKNFQPSGTKECAFTVTGFNNWKNALDRKKGFPAHQLSKNHLIAAAKCEEKKKREHLNQTVSSLVNDKVLDENRYYISSIVEMIQFLSINQLPYRGTYDAENSCESGLFNNFYEYTLKKDKKLFDISNRIPKNASYLSPKIQNDIIQLMADTVKEDIAKNVLTADVPWYSLFMDGTRTKQMDEMISFGIRYVRCGKVHEQTLSVEMAKNCDAKSLAQLALDLLKKCKIDSRYLLSQCYDGASVMSGVRGGVQTILQNELKRKIPYVHCYNHRLHLTVMKVIAIDEIQDFFNQCTALYNFLKKGNVRLIYEGKRLVRLLEQRWSGHFEVVRLIFENFNDIVRTLKLIKINEEKKFDGDDIALSIGLLHSITNDTFCFCLVLMKKILGILHPADKILQSRTESLEASSRVINSVYETLADLRNISNFDLTVEEAHAFFKDVENEMKKNRIRKKSVMLKNHFIYDFINEPSELDHSTKLQSIYNEAIDCILQELDKRFCSNKDLITALTAVEELNEDITKYDILKELGINIPMKEELVVAKNFIKSEDTRRDIDILEKLYEMQKAFPNVYSLVATSRVFACSTAICESTFSALTQIDRPQRQFMSSQRQANLVLLSFEKNVTKNLDISNFLKKFNAASDRRLQLF